jgi:hypothetical protein
VAQLISLLQGRDQQRDQQHRKRLEESHEVYTSNRGPRLEESHEVYTSNRGPRLEESHEVYTSNQGPRLEESHEVYTSNRGPSGKGSSRRSGEVLRNRSGGSAGGSSS